MEISLYWIKSVFDPQTRSLADGKPRILINDGFATHESLELMTFCFENNIILCRLPSHTSHKLQPCDVGVFGPLKTAYREQVENLFRGGSDTVGKQHFTLLYSRARESAFTSRNIKAGWAKAGLCPFNPDRVLRDTQKPPADLESKSIEPVQVDLLSSGDLLPTPITAGSLTFLCETIKQDHRHLDSGGQHRMEKLAHAAQKFITERALLSEQNRQLVQQNNEKKTRSSVRPTIAGTARIMSYDDILEAQRKREAQESKGAARPALGKKAGASGRAGPGEKRTRLTELGKGKHEIETMALSDYCSVLDI